jgi:hypothetical protein
LSEEDFTDPGTRTNCKYSADYKSTLAGQLEIPKPGKGKEGNRQGHEQERGDDKATNKSMTRGRITSNIAIRERMT